MRADRDGARASKFSRRCLRALIACAIFVAVIILCVILETDVGVSEWCSRYISRPIVWLTGHVSSLFPFSLFEVFVAVAVSAALTLIIVAIVYCANGFFKRGLSHICVLAATALAVGCVYTVCTGFNYHREEMPIPMREDDAYTREEYAEAAQLFFDDFISLLGEAEVTDEGELISPYDLSELSELLRSEAERFDDDFFGGYFTSYTPTFKSMLSSGLMSDLWLNGITFLPLGEANVNTDAPVVDYVSTAAHELMHTKGIMREGDANLASYWLLVTSDNDFLRLCGMFEVAANMQYLLDEEDSDNVILRLEDSGYFKITKFSSSFWQSHNILRKLSSFFNDLYLSINGQGGTDSYHNSSQVDIDQVPVVDENGDPVIDENGDPVVDNVIVNHSLIQRFVAYHYLG